VASEEKLPRGVQLSEAGVLAGPVVNLEPPVASSGFDGEARGVVWRNVDGDAGDSGRRKGELRGEP
jgi:hypothetical protein